MIRLPIQARERVRQPLSDKAIIGRLHGCFSPTQVILGCSNQTIAIRLVVPQINGELRRRRTRSVRLQMRKWAAHMLRKFTPHNTKPDGLTSEHVIKFANMARVLSSRFFELGSHDPESNLAVELFQVLRVPCGSES